MNYPFQRIQRLVINQYFSKMMKSQLVQLDITNKNGVSTRYYTYDGYYEQRDRLKIREFKKKVQKETLTCSTICAILSYHLSKKFDTPTLSYKTSRIPVKGLFSGALTFGLAYLIIDFIQTSRVERLQRQVALSSKHLPLWKNKKFAVNPDRAYFQLVDSEDNQISIFHSGLTPEAAANLIPDFTIGSIPSKPHKLGSAHH